MHYLDAECCKTTHYIDGEGHKNLHGEGCKITHYLNYLDGEGKKITSNVYPQIYIPLLPLNNEYHLKMLKITPDSSNFDD